MSNKPETFKIRVEIMICLLIVFGASNQVYTWVLVSGTPFLQSVDLVARLGPGQRALLQ
jgi:hypothetical protein